MAEYEAKNDTCPCRYCRQPIAVGASKCHHCGEQLTTRSPLAQFTRKSMGLVGVGTALLSLFFGLKEGYFYIMERQQQRAMAASHLAAAEHFLDLDSLSYAEASLERALVANPNDQHLRARIFFLRASHLLRDADYYGGQMPEDKFDSVPDMIIDGFSLLNNNFAPAVRAELMLTLARLLQYDQQWQADTGITELFEQAYQLAPQDPEVAYWFGAWLRTEDTTKERGFALIQAAATAASNNAVYVTALGKAQAEQGDFGVALRTLMAAIDSRPEQHELQNIRAANHAKQYLARSLSDAHAAIPITGQDFFGLTMDERVSMVRYALQHSSGRRLNGIAAELFHHAGLNAEAEIQIIKVLGKYNVRSSAEDLTLLAAILAAQNKTTEEQAVLQLLARQEELAGYEEVLETGLAGEHRYKLGLRLARGQEVEMEVEGVLVLKAYEQYPFHKAGVRSGDRLLTFGHRTLHNMLSVSSVMLTFTPGADVPLQVQRGNDVLDLIVVIE